MALTKEIVVEARHVIPVSPVVCIVGHFLSIFHLVLLGTLAKAQYSGIVFVIVVPEGLLAFIKILGVIAIVITVLNIY